MAKKLSKSGNALEDGEPLPTIEDIMSAGSWDAKLAKARAKRERALEKQEKTETANSQNSSQKIEGANTVQSTTPDGSENVSSSDIPSIDDILTTPNWSEQFAKASARREQIMAQRAGGQNAALRSDEKANNQPFKNVIRGAFTGKTAQVHSQPSPATVVLAGKAQAVPKKAHNRKYGRIAALIALFIGFAMVLATPVIDLFRADPIEFATKIEMLDVSPALPGIGDADQSVAPMNLPLLVQTSRSGVQPASIAQPSGGHGEFIVPKIELASLSFTPATHVPPVTPPLADQGREVYPIVGYSTDPFARTAPAAMFGRSQEFETNSDLVMVHFHPSNSYTDVTKSLPIQAELLNLIALPASSQKVSVQRPPKRLATLNPAEFSQTVLFDAEPLSETYFAKSQPPLVSLIAPQSDALTEFRFPTMQTYDPGVTTGGREPTAQSQDQIFASLTPPQAFEEPTTASNAATSRAASIHVSLNAPDSLADAKLNAFASALRETGFNVGDAKRVGFNISKNNVRFFYTQDADAAKILADAVGGKARDFTDYRPQPPVGTIEIWLAGKPSTPKPQSAIRRTSREDPALTALRAKLLKSLRNGDYQ